jgi:hypothetical protein
MHGSTGIPVKVGIIGIVIIPAIIFIGEPPQVG